MAISYPVDILQGWPGWTLSFDLLYRQEQSRQANGVTRIKDFSNPLWRTSVTTKMLTRRQMDLWRATCDQLENGLQTFYGYSLSRCWPTLYPNGTWPTGGSFTGLTANLASINVNNKSITLSALPVGFTLSVGDFIQIGTNSLHRVMESAVANGSGVTPAFEVRPQLWPGTITGTAVSVKRAHCLMTLVPGSLVTAAAENGLGKITFDAVEYR